MRPAVNIHTLIINCEEREEGKKKKEYEVSFTIGRLEQTQRDNGGQRKRRSCD
jgi:hypothetical protein